MFDKKILKEKLHPVLLEYYHGYISYVPFFLDPDYYKKVSGKKANKESIAVNPSVGCWCGSFYSINPVGDVAPCPLLGDNVSGGNVLKKDIHEILFKSELFTKIIDRSNFKGKCGTCKYNQVCGGCRAITYYLTGDLYQSDPTCFIDDLSEKELQDIEKKTTKNFRNYLRLASFGGHYEYPDD